MLGGPPHGVTRAGGMCRPCRPLPASRRLAQSPGARLLKQRGARGLAFPWAPGVVLLTVLPGGVPGGSSSHPYNNVRSYPAVRRYFRGGLQDTPMEL